ncbi:STAS domain-containing protein [Aquitalea magnusonii]|uniref:Anti-anti-sigma factor n=1 Tax=Aquitalea magnusonii TaxID=332411 RepID=A0A318JLF2_9NEIS|nr:STAS domain-containing protein [Aquitalea magnusonii]PXX48029.1 anti-anti-sigma factor [Aquitalea magnusonii]
MSHLITLAAEQTIYQAQAVHQQLAAALREHAQLEVDLSQIEEIDSAGAQVLLWLHRAAQQQSCQLTLSHPSPAVRDFIRLLGLQQLHSALEAADGS